MSEQPIFIPVRCIDAVTKIGRKFFSGPTHYSMSMQCKDLRSYRFAFDQDLHPRRQVFQYLQQLAFGDPMQVFAFSYADVNLLAASQMRPLYDPVAEFRRMGVFTGSHYVDGVSRGWCLTTINRDYSLCPSYPSVLVKPQYISQDLLLTAAAFRYAPRHCLSSRVPSTHSLARKLHQMQGTNTDPDMAQQAHWSRHLPQQPTSRRNGRCALHRGRDADSCHSRLGALLGRRQHA